MALQKCSDHKNSKYLNKQFYISILFVMSIVFFFGQDMPTTFLFVGSYTSGIENEGIVVFAFDTKTGELREVEKEGNLINPSYLTISPNGKFLYACTETKMDKHGSVSAFKIDTLSGQLTFLNKQSTGGKNPVHLVVSKNNEHVIASNYTDAGISTFKCNSDGNLLPMSQLLEFKGNSIIEGRQDDAHIHSCNFSPDGKYVFSTDLGTDEIRTFKFNEESLLTAIDTLTIKTTQGSGPRHLTFHPTEPFAYCAEELSGTISCYRYQNGKLIYISSYESYEFNQEEYASSDIHISPDGKFLYASNRQDENSISIFKIHKKSGKLSLQEHQSTHGTIPRSFIIDPTGKYLIVANQTSDNLVIFSRDFETGVLTKLNVLKGLKSPTSLKMIKYDS